MAARTPSAIQRESLGSLTLHIATFTDIDDADTWASGIPGIVGAWTARTDNPAASCNGIDTAYSGSTLTFYTAEANTTGDVFVLSKS